MLSPGRPVRESIPWPSSVPRLFIRLGVFLWGAYGGVMTRYRFLDGMGDVVDEGDFAEHAAALAWARDEDEHDADVQRVEYLGDRGDWRWAGPLLD